MIPAVLWAFCLLFWFGCGVRCLLFLSSLFFLSATYLTEPGLIPKGAPLTPEQNRLLASASCTSPFSPLSPSATPAAPSVHLHQGRRLQPPGGASALPARSLGAADELPLAGARSERGGPHGAAVRAGGEGEPEGDRERVAGTEGRKGERECGAGGDHVCERRGGGSAGGEERSVGAREDPGAEEAGGGEDDGCVFGRGRFVECLWKTEEKETAA